MTQPKSGLAAGINKGHIVTVKTLKSKPSNRKGVSVQSGLCLTPVLSKRTKFVRELIREVSGFSPYEKRLMELIRVSKDKRAKRLAKKKLGTFIRGKRKIEELTSIIQESRRTGAH
ncbi:hypothetical protein HK096_010671 [Nowakowskiella sp. JEL0078]|nr:hypothetical protein HK096_010671 [Nowakowskiella sp. JEL0078]